MAWLHIHRWKFVESGPANIAWVNGVAAGDCQVTVDRCGCGKERVRPVEGTMKWYAPRAREGTPKP